MTRFALVFEKKELPEGWVKTNVGQLYDVIGGGTPSTKIEKYWKGNIPWISSADIYDLYDIRSRRNITIEAVKNSATNLVPSESIIVVTRVGLGKIAYTKTPICFSQDSQALVGNNSLIDPHYAIYYLSKAVQIFKHSNRGTTISGVTKKQLSELSFLLPSFNEQKRIVSKIESIFTQIDACQVRLERLALRTSSASDSLAQLKSSVLKQAFEGKLVPQDPTDESAEMLLKRINLDSDKNAEFETGELPDGWINAKLRSMVENIKKINPKNMPNKLFYYCDINSIDNSQFRITTPKQFLGKDAPSRARQSIKSKDILFSTVRTYLKNIATIPSYLDGHLASTGFCVLRPKQDIDNTYIFNYVQSERFLSLLNSKQRGTSYPAVRDSDVLNSVISLPPFREQRRIVSKIESIFDRIDANDFLIFICMFFIVFYFTYEMMNQSVNIES